jgi:hypothetical protein
MNILYFYAHTQTYTATVFEHIQSLGKYSRNNIFYISSNQESELNVNLDNFDAIIIHYSIRLPFDQIPECYINDFQEFKGIKAIFIQDEYDYTKRAWYWIKRLNITLVFTVVPRENISKAYPTKEFPGVSFVNVLTGYVPEILPQTLHKPPSQRSLMVGYRGRPLPIRYGALGQEKSEIGRLVREFCEEKDISCDIEWSEEMRIYGDGWYDFVFSCRAMLGSESGSNVFDWDGTLLQQIDKFKSTNPAATDKDIYLELISDLEIANLMNQVSPRVFEAIACRTVLVLFEGDYSGVLTPWEHFIPVKKDGSNLEEVFRLLHDDEYVDTLVDRAYNDIIMSGVYSYEGFVKIIDEGFEKVLMSLPKYNLNPELSPSGQIFPLITPLPIKNDINPTQKDINLIQKDRRTDLIPNSVLRKVVNFFLQLLPVRLKDNN